MVVVLESSRLALFLSLLPISPLASVSLSLSLAHILYVHRENTLCIRLLAKALERRLLTGAFDRNGIAADRNLIPLEITADYTTTRRSFSTSRLAYETWAIIKRRYSSPDVIPRISFSLIVVC